MRHKKLISKAEFARLAGVTGASITKAIGKGLAVAMEGKRINVNHPEAERYIESRTSTTKDVTEDKEKPLLGYAAKNKAKKDAVNDDEILDIPENIQSFLDYPLRELIEKFGTDIRFNDWLKATKLIEDINEKRLKNAETQSILVSRRLMKLGVIDPINSAHIKLLTDGAKTISLRVVAMHGAGSGLDEIQKFVSGQITSFIKPVKAKITRAMRL